MDFYKSAEMIERYKWSEEISVCFALKEVEEIVRGNLREKRLGI